MTTHTSGAADLPEAPTTFCWATELAMTNGLVTLSVAEAREISAEMQRLHALAAGQAVAPAPKTERVYLVNTGEIRNGMEFYERHDAPVPLCDYEVLYSRPVFSAMDGGEDAALWRLLLKPTDDTIVAAMEVSCANRPSVDDDSYVLNILKVFTDAARAAQKEGATP